ncbi:MAG: UDP-glucose 4-epimerase GalE [Bacteroidia bacterium]|nr:UDP-glucose 4-epimerase GalE [Bacteroidia bacterium]MBP9690259.1 UDP-glucose 4-epimerase GalE [Bacteroidia bacterium]
MKVLVTGGSGFIGSHTVVELQQAGYDVVAIDNFENSSPQVVDNIKTITGKSFDFIEADIRDKKALDAVFIKHPNIEAVIHFAAYKAVGESVEKPLAYYENNVGGTVNLVEAMQKHGVQNIVFSSSCTVYGDVSADVLPITENSPVVKANSPYGNTKKICEELLFDVSKSSTTKIVALRYFNPIGAHDTALIGELPNGVPSNLIPFVTQTAIGIREKLTVFGDDYPTRDGSCIRDFIHVVDLAKAHVKAIEFLKKNNNQYSVFNIGTGTGNTVLEAIKAFEKVSGKKLNYVIGPRREGDVVQIYASCDKAINELGWKAERSLENSLETAWKWELHLAEKAKSTN